MSHATSPLHRVAQEPVSTTRSVDRLSYRGAPERPASAAVAIASRVVASEASVHSDSIALPSEQPSRADPLGYAVRRAELSSITFRAKGAPESWRRFALRTPGPK